jgi:hypothetical protein
LRPFCLCILLLDDTEFLLLLFNLYDVSVIFPQTGAPLLLTVLLLSGKLLFRDNELLEI